MELIVCKHGLEEAAEKFNRPCQCSLMHFHQHEVTAPFHSPQDHVILACDSTASNSQESSPALAGSQDRPFYRAHSPKGRRDAKRYLMPVRAQKGMSASGQCCDSTPFWPCRLENLSPMTGFRDIRILMAAFCRSRSLAPMTVTWSITATSSPFSFAPLCDSAPHPYQSSSICDQSSSIIRIGLVIDPLSKITNQTLPLQCYRSACAVSTDTLLHFSSMTVKRGQGSKIS